MRVISVSLQNFASYKSLNFTFLNQGLTLVGGPTGSGKSTLCDAIPWLAFGRTAKNGEVSEVLSWPGTEVTKGSLHVEVGEDAYIIHRSRGPKPKDNDLSYMVIGSGEERTRGKDLLDTQKLINGILGIDCDLYLAGAYYHEFSQTAQFFTTTAKNRRAICEQVVDLSLAKTLQYRLLENTRGASKLLESLTSQESTLKANIDLLSRMYTAETVRLGAWETDKKRRIRTLSHKYDNFEVEKATAVEDLLEQEKKYFIGHKTAHEAKCAATNCSECGTFREPLDIDYVEPDSPFTDRIMTEINRCNTYEEQLMAAIAEVNPHQQAAQDISLDKLYKEQELEGLTKRKVDLTLEVDDLDLLAQVVADYRTIAITNTISSIEASTNQLLTDHFDAEFRVAFSASDADKIDVEITKDGNQCSYTQLSKGQRQLLKLCFGVSVMQAVSNHHGVKFESIFIDEALDGLDDQMKLKAYNLLQTISLLYNNIFVVEHSEALKSMFDNQYSVSLVDGKSQIEKA